MPLQIILPTLTSMDNDLFNDTLWLGNKLSATSPRGRYGQWTEVKTQISRIQIVWWNRQIWRLVTLVPEDQIDPNFTAIYNVTPLRPTISFNYNFAIALGWKQTELNIFGRNSANFHPRPSSVIYASPQTSRQTYARNFGFCVQVPGWSV